MGEPSRSSRIDDVAQPCSAAWGRVLGHLKDEVGETAYRSWLQSLRVERIDEGEAVVAAPTRFLRNWVATHYADRLLALWRVENPAVGRLSLIVDPDVAPPAPEAAGFAEVSSAPGVAAEPASPAEIADDRGYLSAPLDPRFTFENFVVGKPNELAHAAARRVAEACAGPVHAVPFNPLFLYGGVGLGKTHLMHAIAWHVRMNAPRAKVIYLSAEKFMYQFIRALRFRSTMDFKDQFRSVDLLMIDDVQFISGKESTQEEFFHTFNALVDQNRQIVISADKSPSSLEGLEERMRSRLGWGLVADIHPTTYELRLGILQSKAEQSGLRLPQKLMEFLAHKIVSNVRELEGALNRITAQMQLVGRELTLESVQELQPTGPHRRPAAPGRDVSGKAADLALAARDRAQIRRPRSHHRHACGEKDRGADRQRPGHRRGCRALAPDAANLTRSVIASEAKQSRAARLGQAGRDCFVAPLLAMTARG